MEFHFMRKFSQFFMLFAALFLSACEYTGGSIDPIGRKFTWFSYVNGDDIRKVCSSLGADRYRFVYNGIYQRQTRSYDVFFHSKKITMKVTGASNLNKLSTNDLLAPWRGVEETILIGDNELNALKETLLTSAALQPAPDGLRLYSDEFYWIVSACVEGKFYFNAYLWPSKRWDAMTFDDLLFNLDTTGVEVENPRNLSPVDIWGGMDKVDRFLLQLGKNGLIGQQGG
jgi:hypothetical protein